MANKDETHLRTGRRPDPGRNHQRGTPRIIWLALLIGIVGAVLLFRSPGGGKTSGIGENRSVITVPADDLDTMVTNQDLGGSLPESTQVSAQPRSGDVEIQQISPVLTPENPEPGSPAQKEPAPAPTAAPKKTYTAPAEQKAVPEIQPEAAGSYLVQTGSFGKAQNADQEADRLQKLGWDARVKVSSTAGGDMVYRVRVGFFKDRTTAEQFIHTHRDQLRGAIAVHR